ncbi:hypothetical protein HDU99_004604 [Rhizoclosmatium hyalinum]|nr:hypothetical protein HDU99_004604 [Rhizoclosmatium hyalinum]
MTTYWTLPLLLASLASAARTQSASSHLVPAYGVVIPSWQGFGTSLGPWACVAGGSSMETKYADLFFTTKTVTLKIGGVDIPLPGLGLNIVRYNVGGTGRQGDFPGVTEYFNGGVSSTATGLNWWDLVEGYWINGLSNSSSNWDWSRDVNQRSMLKAAIARNVQYVEFYSQSPMWWMTAQKSSLGGNLTDDTLTLFPEYVSQVVKHAINDWKVNVTSVSILNEPSKGNWNYPNITEEGLNVVGKAEKVALLTGLRTRLNSFNLTSVKVSGSDEYDYDTAYANLDGVVPAVQQFNVHGYEMSNTARSKLSTAIGDLPFWMSEYGDADNSGMNMATALLNDINHLNPNAWLYKQLVADKTWGMIYASNFGSSPTDPARAVATDIASKYYVFAQFTRFIRPGDQILNSGSNTVILAHNPATNTYKFVVVVYKSSLTVTLNLSSMIFTGTKTLPKSVSWTYTATDGSVLFGKFNSAITGKKIVFRAHKNSVYSVEI